MNTLSTNEYCLSSEQVTELENPIRMAVVNVFGDNLRKQRQEKQISTWHVMKITGISPSNLVSIEKGRRPASDDVLQKLASIPELDLTVEQMLSWKALDQFGPDVILQAAQEVLQERSEQAQ
jgi:transcriptional regulator with XRE-family HTH domain